MELRLEPVLGGTLTTRLPLPCYLQGLQVMSQCLSAVAYLHGHTPPIVHRDIKPANILVNDGPRGIQIKLADFGLSREARGLISICGTQTYFPPEFWTVRELRDHGGDANGSSPAIDIWSLGVVAFECFHKLPQRPSFLDIQWCKCIRQTLEANLGPPGHVSRFILSDMVCMKPKDRSSAEECDEHIASVLSWENRPARQGPVAGPRRSRPLEESGTPNPQRGVKRFRADEDCSDAEEDVAVCPPRRVKYAQRVSPPSDERQHHGDQWNVRVPPTMPARKNNPHAISSPLVTKEARPCRILPVPNLAFVPPSRGATRLASMAPRFGGRGCSGG